MYDCFSNMGELFREELKKDYLINIRPGKRPLWFGDADRNVTEIAYELFKDEENKKKNFPFYYDVPAKEIMKHIYAERFSYGILLFDYKRNDVYVIE